MTAVESLASIPEHKTLEIFSPIFNHLQTNFANWPSDCKIIEPLLHRDGYTTSMLDGPYVYLDVGEHPPLPCRSTTLALLGHCADCNKLNYCSANDNFPDQLASILHSHAAHACPVCSPGRHEAGQFFYVYYEGGNERTEIVIPERRTSRSSSDEPPAEIAASSRAKRSASPPSEPPQAKRQRSEGLFSHPTSPTSSRPTSPISDEPQRGIDAFIASGGKTPFRPF